MAKAAPKKTAKGRKAAAKAVPRKPASKSSGKPAAKKPARETDAWLSIYSGGMPWIDMPATEPLKTMDEIARMGVRDFYVDQCCDAVVVTEVTEDTVTALCDYGS